MINVSVESTNPKNIAADVQAAIARALDRLAGVAQGTAKAEAPANTGQLRNSILTFRNYVPPIFEAGIQTNLPYALVMEDGRRPGSRFPPVEAIFRWVFLKRSEFQARPSKSRPGPLTRRQARLTASRSGRGNLHGLAFVIARSIARKGIRGRKFFAKAFEAVEKAAGDSVSGLDIEITSAWNKGG